MSELDKPTMWVGNRKTDGKLAVVLMDRHTGQALAEFAAYDVMDRYADSLLSHNARSSMLQRRYDSPAETSCPVLLRRIRPVHISFMCTSEPCAVKKVCDEINRLAEKVKIKGHVHGLVSASLGGVKNWLAHSTIMVEEQGEFTW